MKILRALFIFFAFPFLGYLSPCKHSEGFPSQFLDEKLQMSEATKQFLTLLNAQPFPMNAENLEKIRKMPATPTKNLSSLDITEETIDTYLPVKIYTPKKEGTFPLVVFFHGGGWVVGTLDNYDAFCQKIAAQGNCVVVSVGYRLAPEAAFPIPLEDCYLATQWAHANKVRLKGSRLIVAGDSAGGNLAAAVTLLARERKGPKIDHQVLICPVTNANFETLSYTCFSSGYYLTKEAMEFFWKNYVSDQEKRKNALASPLQTPCFEGLPPATVAIAYFDPLRDEGLAYGLNLFRANVPTQIKVFPSFHGFYLMENLQESTDVLSFIVSQIKE